jgi:hypothetical protein
VLVRGELDWIVMKALEKDRQRRYETANGLAMDIRRYLAARPWWRRRPAVEAIDAQFASQPLVDAALRHTLSEVFLNLGSGEEALSLAQRALDLRRRELGVHDRETLASLERVAMIVESLGKVAEAEAVYREGL